MTLKLVPHIYLTKEAKRKVKDTSTSDEANSKELAKKECEVDSALQQAYVVREVCDASSEMWYDKGLSFECTGCGKCCTGSPGYTFVNIDEMQEMAKHLNMPFDEFTSKYVKKVGKRYSLLEKPISYDCIFLNEGKCSIYQVRPTQCRTYPWWTSNLRSKEDWEKAAKECEGITLNAPVVPKETIEKERLKQESYERETSS